MLQQSSNKSEISIGTLSMTNIFLFFCLTFFVGVDSNSGRKFSKPAFIGNNNNNNHSTKISEGLSKSTSGSFLVNGLQKFLL
jgi:hypothetical protein